MDRYGVRTKTGAVDLALRHLAGQPMTRDEACAVPTPSPSLPVTCPRTTQSIDPRRHLCLGRV